MAKNAVKKSTASTEKNKYSIMLENASIHGCEHNDDHAGNNQNQLRHHCWSQDLIQGRDLFYLSAQSRAQVEICQKAILSIWMRE